MTTEMVTAPTLPLGRILPRFPEAGAMAAPEVACGRELRERQTVREMGRVGRRTLGLHAREPQSLLGFGKTPALARAIRRSSRPSKWFRTAPARHRRLQYQAPRHRH